MNTIALKDLKPQTYFSKPLFLDEGYVLLAPETPVDEGLIKRLTVWEFREARTEGTSLDSAREDEPEAGGQQDDKAAKASLTDGASDREKLEEVLAFYADFARYMEGLYTRFVTKNELDYKELGERMKRLCQVIGQNRRLLLRAQATAPQHKNYLVSHAVRTSVYSIILGTALKLPSFKLIELGSAAALHEIGMVRLPPLLYMSGRSLSPQERKAITAHPLLGYNLLKERQIPLSVCLAALEHHERVNGSGYPRALTGEKISLYSKIIMVACSFDAVTADRPYKEAKDGYSGMVDIIKNEGKQYDDLVIRALVYSLSIYPIGTRVLLTSGKKAMVVDINPENPRYPVVQMLGARTPDGKDVVLRTSEAGTRVQRPLTKEEIAEEEAQA
jgi:HD-GYP domain-containing protein (c-di-GMP phosphodiesterase class II)